MLFPHHCMLFSGVESLPSRSHIHTFQMSLGRAASSGCTHPHGTSAPWGQTLGHPSPSLSEAQVDCGGGYCQANGGLPSLSLGQSPYPHYHLDFRACSYAHLQVRRLRLRKMKGPTQSSTASGGRAGWGPVCQTLSCPGTRSPCAHLRPLPSHRRSLSRGLPFSEALRHGPGLEGGLEGLISSC